jgi:hypothetical protein
MGYHMGILFAEKKRHLAGTLLNLHYHCVRIFSASPLQAWQLQHPEQSEEVLATHTLQKKHAM